MTFKTLFPRGVLDQFAQDFGTDKSIKNHDYMRLYEFVFAPYKDSDFCFMELGVGLPRIEAASLRSWRKYFSKAKIVGIDNDKRVKKFSGEEFTIEIGDASRPRFLNRMMDAHKPSIVLDDASHKWSHQIAAFRTIFPLLPPGGIYVIEDLFTSFPMPEKYDVYADHPESAWQYISRLQTSLVGAQTDWPPVSPEESELISWIDCIFVARKTAIFVKRVSQRPEEIARVEEQKRRQE